MDVETIIKKNEMENHEEYLKNINKNIWKYNKDPISKRKWETIARQITNEEWKNIKSILKNHIEDDYIIEMKNFHFGFTCGLWISKIIEPIYPNIPFEFEHILAISAKHIFGETGPTFEKGWEEFSLFSHNEKNKRTLLRVGKKLPGAKWDYAY